MQLIYSISSPYARKCLVLAHETGIAEKVEVVSSPPSPVERNNTVFAANPAGKVPALVLADKSVLFDSRVICQYLDSIGNKPMYPESGPARWQTLRREAMADALLDAALLARYETFLRPKELLWDKWLNGQMDKIATILKALDEETPEFAGEIDAAQIAIACALGYLDFRFADYDWRTEQPKLADWFAEVSKRSSMVATAPDA